MAVADNDYAIGRALLVRHLADGRRIIREQAGPDAVRWTDAARTGRAYNTEAAERLLKRAQFRRDGNAYTICRDARVQTPTYYAQKDSN